ncbi:PREDICTED: inducible metalloproteinase inhibitor protein-like [Papilio polytes]|uniref:inducible metalloproteinase inhibitor protein-like n=1 Tax=Papilio polytes TaxID=76194 RepID=UPI0006763655|nr:PREDICTED: inducible metalloproteinase inhibitor protein-like [Papilio polytes]
MSSYVFISVILMAIIGMIVASPVDEKKPFDCPANEKYYKCSLEVCYKKCDNLFNPPPCPSIAANCYQPSCECVDGYLRDSNGICVTEEQCRTQFSSAHYSLCKMAKTKIQYPSKC